MTIRRLARLDRVRDFVRDAIEEAFGEARARPCYFVPRRALDALCAAYQSANDAREGTEAIDEGEARRLLGMPSGHDDFAGQCDECDLSGPDLVLVRIGDDPPEYDGDTVDLCPECVADVVHAMGADIAPRAADTIVARAKETP